MIIQNITSSKISTFQTCPSSKSVTNRLLILASLCNEPIEICNVSFCDDVRLLIEGLTQMGIEITSSGNNIVVQNSYRNASKKTDQIYLGEGGTTIRFLTIFSTLFQEDFVFKVEKRFLKRPQDELTKALHDLGVEVNLYDDLISIKGCAKKNLRLVTDCSQTTQVASALLLISEEINLNVKIDNLSSSKTYIEMTKTLLMNKSVKHTVTPDFSSLSYFIVWGALVQKLVIQNVFEIDQTQADSKMLAIYKKLGGTYQFKEDGLHINPITKFADLDVDINDCLDLFPALIFLLSYTGKKHKISGLNNLKYKESDRLLEGCKLLEKFSIQHEVLQDNLIIKNKPDCKAQITDIRTAHDHRMVICAALFLKYNSGGTCGPSEAVNKSFPDFFSSFESR